MKQPAIIWRESIYNNDYVCRCGKVLMDKGKLCEDMLVDVDTMELICPQCKLNVALLADSDFAEEFAFKAMEA